jgi:hypothetical protein
VSVDSTVTDTSRFDIDMRDDVSNVRSTATAVDPFEWFQRLWGLAVVAHVVGNPRLGQVFPDPTVLGIATLLAGALGVAAVVLRYDRRIVVALSATVLATVWLEAPIIGNHWLLAGFVSAALLMAMTSSDSWSVFAVTGRSLHLVFYAFAALAKLNSAFFDPSVSCSVVFANRSLAAVGLPIVDRGSSIAALLPYLITGIEWLIPLLLLRRQTRTTGVLVGLAFHGLISFDLDQHLYDFTAVLVPLFLLWLPDSVTERLGRDLPRRMQLALGSLLGVFVLASIGPLNRVSLTIPRQAFFVLWIPALVGLVVWLFAQSGLTADVRYRPTTTIAWVLVGVAFLNGLTPYLELKSATSWNMYSNLTVVEGVSNHFIIRAGVPASAALSNPVEILQTDDPGLSRYIGSGYLLPRRNFLEYLDANPGVEVVYRQGGLVKSGIGASIGSPSPTLIRKFGAFRAIDSLSPTRCDPVWLPAR